MKNYLKNSLLLLISVILVFSPVPTSRHLTPQSKNFHLAPWHEKIIMPEEAAGLWVARQIRGMLSHGQGEVTPEELLKIQRDVYARIQFNPWDVGFEWIWWDPEKLLFEYVLGGGSFHRSIYR